MATTVNVKGISHATTQKEIEEFFSFCGKISSLEVKPERNDAESPKEATVVFEKETAAKTALLLDNTMLGSAEVHVTAGGSSTTTGASTTSTTKSGETSATGEGSDLTQEDKPRSRIIAEYLAQGYLVGDKAIERALALDQQHGISTRFNSALKDFDSRTKATENAQAIDSKYSVTARAYQGWNSLASYFEKAAETPTGQRLRAFYEQGQKQVLDVHNEARHLADLKSGKPSTTGESGSTTAQAVGEKIEQAAPEKTASA